VIRTEEDIKAKRQIKKVRMKEKESKGRRQKQYNERKNKEGKR
jgi:hypothetical protein